MATRAEIEQRKSVLAAIIGVVSWPGVLYAIVWLHSPGPVKAYFIEGVLSLVVAAVIGVVVVDLIYRARR